MKKLLVVICAVLLVAILPSCTEDLVSPEAGDIIIQTDDEKDESNKPGY